MKFVTSATNQILGSNGKWENIGVFEQEVLEDEPVPAPKVYEIHTFKDLQDFASQFYGMWNETTLFTHRPCVRIQYGISFTDTIREKSFNRCGSLKFRTIYKKFNPTMKWLAENLSADNFAQYAKDRGWNNIVISE